MNELKQAETNERKSDSGEIENYSLMREFWDFLKHSKRWWLLPIVIIMMLLSIFIVLTSSSPIFPMIYALF